MSANSPADLQSAVLNGLQWRCIGPHRGGRVVAVAGHPTDPYTFYFGAVAGGVWKSNDGGTYWENISDGFFTTSAVGAIAVSQSDPNIIWVGTGETSIRGNVSHGDGVYKSTDGGKSWRNMGLKDTRHIGRVRIHPTNPDIVYIAALGHAWGPNEERGVFRTKDGGQSWEKVLYKSERAGSHDLSMDPSNPRLLYAAVWDAQRYPHALRSGGPDSGLWRSTDGGDSWQELTRKPGLPKGVLGKIGVTASPAKSGRVWAVVEALDGAVFRSDDYGETWERLAEDALLRTRAWYYMHIFADPTDAETVWILNYSNWKSIDGGKTFQEVPIPHGDNHDLWIDPRDTRRLIHGNDGGACVSYNGGVTWSSIFNQPTAQMYHVMADDRVPYYVYGSQQDNSAIGLPSMSLEGAVHEREWFAPGGGESGYISVKPDDPDVYVGGAIGSGAFNGRLTHFNKRTGQERNITVWPELAGMGTGAIDLKYRFQWTYPIFWSRHNPNELYVAGNRVFRSKDQGQSWEVLSEDLTRNDPEKLQPSGGPITKDNTGAEAYCTIFVLEESHQQPGLIWAGTDDGRVHISEDGGRHFQEITPPELRDRWALISIIDPSPHDANTAYMAATRYKHDDTAPYLFKTTDGGATWQKITNGIPDGEFTRTIRQDPVQPNLLFAGTETGIWVSFDDGQNWQRIGGNLPVTPIHDLIIKGDDLVVATHGRSFWILDDLGPLRQIAEGISDGTAQLFRPPTYERIQVGSGFGSNVGGDYADYQGSGTSVVAFKTKKLPNGETKRVYLNAGQNPPNGVAISYYLRDKPKDTITLTILDEAGKEIRTFSSKPAKDEGADQPPIGEGAEGTADPASAAPEDEDIEPSVPAEAGLNRFVWDLRFPGPTVVKGQKLDPWERGAGPRALPGRYQARLTAGGQTFTEPFEVLKDPREDVGASDADLKAQFDLLLELRDALSETNAAINKLRGVREQVESWEKRFKGQENGQPVLDAAKSLKDELTAIEEQLIDTTAGKSPLMAPAQLSEKLNALIGFVDSADYAPPQQARDVFAELSKQQAEASKRLDKALKEQVAAFNKAVQEAGVPAVGG